MLTLSRTFRAMLIHQQSSIVPMWPRPPPLSGFVLPRKKTRPTTEVLPFRVSRQLILRPPYEHVRTRREITRSRRTIVSIRRPSIESEPDAEEPVEPGTTFRPPPEYLRRVPWSRRSVLPIRRPSIESEPDAEEPVEPGTTPTTEITMQPQPTPRLSFLPRPRNLFDNEVVAEEVPQPPTTNPPRFMISYEYTSYFRPRNPRRESMFFGYAVEPEEAAVEVQPEPEQQPLTTDEDEDYVHPQNPRRESTLVTFVLEPEEMPVEVQPEPEPQHDIQHDDVLEPDATAVEVQPEPEPHHDNQDDENLVQPTVRRSHRLHKLGLSKRPLTASSDSSQPQKNRSDNVVLHGDHVCALRRSPRLALKPRVDYTKFF
jgi:hypothetical protein